MQTTVTRAEVKLALDKIHKEIMELIQSMKEKEKNLDQVDLSEQTNLQQNIRRRRPTKSD